MPPELLIAPDVLDDELLAELEFADELDELDEPDELDELAELSFLVALVASSLRSIQLLHRWAEVLVLIIGVISRATPLGETMTLVLLAAPSLERRPIIQLRTVWSRPLRELEAARETLFPPNLVEARVPARPGASPVYPPNGARRPSATLLEGANTVMIFGVDEAIAA